MKMNKKLGFTLAETLITLIIIGVVAALTIPNMIARHQKREIEVGLQKTYAELQNWLKRVEVDHGPFAEWNVYTTNSTEEHNTFLDTYIFPYMKLTKIKQTTVYAPTATKEPGRTIWTPTPYQLPDGRIFYISRGGFPNWTPPGKELHIMVDVNGLKGQSIMGQDVFKFYINNFRGPAEHPANTLGLGTDNVSHDTTWLINNCITHTSPGTTCGILIQQNGWKFPDNYPIKF